jgi:hypothetical protein
MNTEAVSGILNSPCARTRSVLVFSGTGFSMWKYLPFLQQFSLSQLSEFRHIYGISGGASCLWYYVLSQMGLFDTVKIKSYESAMRTLNKDSILQRLWKLTTNSFIYETQELADGIENFASTRARHLTFSEFPLTNFTAVGHDYVQNSVQYLNQQTAPNLNMADAMAALSSPRLIRNRRFCNPIHFDNFNISDFDFAGSGLRQVFKEHLVSQYAECSIYWLNIFFGGQKSPITYVKVGAELFPRVGQMLDLAAFFCGIPNARIYRRSVSE